MEIKIQFVEERGNINDKVIKQLKTREPVKGNKKKSWKRKTGRGEKGRKAKGEDGNKTGKKEEEEEEEDAVR